MEDPVADESYRVLAASIATRAPTEPSPASSASAEPPPSAATPGGELPLTPSGQVQVTPSLSGQGAVEDPADQRRIVAARSSFTQFGTMPLHHVEGSSYHTMVPRMMVVAAMLATLGSPLFFGVLYHQGHFDIIGNDWYFNDRGRSVAVAGLVALVSCFALGWLWWTVAAALNASRTARYAVSPLFAPIAIAIIAGCGYLLPQAIRAQVDAPEVYGRQLIICVVLVLVPVIAHFMTLAAYSRTAGAVGASQRPWALVIALPWVMVALNLLARFFTNAVGDAFLTITGVVNLAFVGLYVLGFYQALSSFDRACSGRQMAHTDRGGVPTHFARAR